MKTNSFIFRSKMQMHFFMDLFANMQVVAANVHTNTVWVRQDDQCFTRCWFPPGKWSCYLRLVAGWRLRAPHLMIFGDAKSAEKMRCNQMQIRGASWEHHLFGSFGFRQQGSQTLSYFFLSPPVHAAWSLLIRAWNKGFQRLCKVSFKTLLRH